MDRWTHAALFVVAGSLLGLAHPMILAGPGMFVAVWSASLPGDAVFVAGMVGTYFAARKTPDALAIPVALVLTWLTYAVAWSITGSAMDFDDAAGDHAPVFVLQWGAAGVIACGLWPWVQRSLEEKAMQAAGSPLPESGGPEA